MDQPRQARLLWVLSAAAAAALTREAQLETNAARGSLKRVNIIRPSRTRLLKHTLSCLFGVLVSVGELSTRSSESSGCHVGGSCKLTDVLEAEKRKNTSITDTEKSKYLHQILFWLISLFPNQAEINLETGTSHMNQLGDTAHHVSSSKAPKLKQ